MLPDISSEEKIKAFLTKNNDTTFVLYVCSIIRAIVSLHRVIDNRILNRETKEKAKLEVEEKKKQKLAEQKAEKEKAVKKSKDDKKW